MSMNIMLDLETWGTTPGSDIRSIGACVFDPDSGTYGDKTNASFGIGADTFYLAVDNPVMNDSTIADEPVYKYPLTRDPKTVQWWSEQSSEAQSAFTNPFDLRNGLISFGRWLFSVSCEYAGYCHDCEGFNPVKKITLWAHGPQFDVSILGAAYRAVKLPEPWHYRTPRDTRTIMEAAGMDPHKGLDIFSTGTHHHALDDAITQAKAVCAAYKVIRSGVPSVGSLDDGIPNIDNPHERGFRP